MCIVDNHRIADLFYVNDTFTFLFNRAKKPNFWEKKKLSLKNVQFDV
jgi:hypothetical protein